MKKLWNVLKESYSIFLLAGLLVLFLSGCYAEVVVVTKDSNKPYRGNYGYYGNYNGRYLFQSSYYHMPRSNNHSKNYCPSKKYNTLGNKTRKYDSNGLRNNSGRRQR